MHVEAENSNQHRQCGDWPRAWVTHEACRWQVSIVDFDPVHGYTHTHHPTQTWPEAMAWLHGMRRILR